MTAFEYQNGALHAEALPLSAIADQYGTPCFVYSRRAIEQAWQEWDNALSGTPHLVCFAVKANSNLAVLNLLTRLGAGFDIVSVGELERVLAAGGEPSRIVFSGLGKTADEMRRALQVGIHCFNVESTAELERLQQVAAELGVKAPISLRVNPDVDAMTHPYISTGLKENKFGIDIAQAPAVYRRAAQMPNIQICGVDCHIGGQLTDDRPLIDALDRLLALIDEMAAEGIHIRHIDLGGGLGVTYRDEVPPTPAAYLGKVKAHLASRDLTVLVEPGRSIVANAGVLLTRVNLLKPTEHKNFAIIDAAMNDLIRPALYSAWMGIDAVAPRNDVATLQWDIVGPVCETGDFLGKDRELALAEGDLLAVRSAGAYGFVMSSNYNTRARAAEVMVDGQQSHLVRRRETLSELFAGESLLPEA
jgi:diaminopimelate decarboxylase